MMDKYGTLVYVPGCELELEHWALRSSLISQLVLHTFFLLVLAKSLHLSVAILPLML